jgi:hypothetical protein
MFEMLAAAGLNVAGGLIGASSAKSAAKAQANAANQATQETRRQFDVSRADLQPFVDAGAGAVQRISHLLGIGDPRADLRARVAAERGIRKPTIEDAKAIVAKKHSDRFGDGYHASSDWGAIAADERATLNSLLQDYNAQIDPLLADAGAAPGGGGDYGSLNQKFTVGDFYADPVNQLGLEFGLNEGRKAIDRGAGAAGLRNSGATLKALTRFGEDYAGTKANDSYNRFYADQDRIFNRLSGVAGSGQTASTNTAQLGAQAAGNVSNILTGAGNARGAAAISKGNAWTNAFDTIGNWWNQKNTLDRILTNNGGIGGGVRQPSFAMPANAYDF